MIHKGVARTFFLYAYSIASGAPKTGDAANIIVYKAEDMGPATQVTDTITEIDPTNMPGWYRFTTTLNGNSAAISAVSSTPEVGVTLGGIYLNTGAIPSAAAGTTNGLPVIGAAPLTNLDATVSSRSTLTAADVWSYGSRTLSGFSFQVTVGGYASGQSPSEQVQGLGYTSARAGKLDNLDASVSSRLAASSYVAPDNAGIAAIKSQADKLTFDANNYVYAVATVDVDEQAIADAVWDEAQSGHTTAGTFGAYLNAAITSRSSHSAADVWNVASRTVTGGTIDTLNDRTGFQLSAAGIDAIWNEPRSEHTIPGTFGAVSEWAGGGSEGSDWTDTEKQQIRYRLGIDGTTESPSTNTPHLGNSYSTLDDLATHVSTRLAASDYEAPDNASISAIKTQTDKLTFDTDNYVYAIATNTTTDWTDNEKQQIRYRLGIDGTTETPSTNTPHLGSTYSTLDDLAAHVSTRLATSDYVPPDNASISAIKTKTDKLTFGTNNYVYSIATNASTDWTATEREQIRYRLGIDGTTQSPGDNTPHLGSTYPTLDSLGSLVSTRLAAADYTPPDNVSISAIKTKTDRLTFWTDDEKEQIRYRLGVDGDTQTPSTNVPHLGSTYSTLDDVGSLVASRLAAEDYVAPDNASILAIKDKTDKLQFNTENAVKSTLSGETVAVELTTQAIDTIIDNFWDEPTTEHTVSGSFGALVSTKLSKLSFNPDNYVYADIGESAGIGSILIDHNYGGTDNLRYVTPGGNGIANGIIKAYLKEDYEAGRISEGYIKGETMTASDGRWRKPLALDPNTYILVFYKPGEYGITAVEVTVTE